MNCFMCKSEELFFDNANHLICSECGYINQNHIFIINSHDKEITLKKSSYSNILYFR